jgi:hypothetical protein
MKTFYIFRIHLAAVKLSPLPHSISCTRMYANSWVPFLPHDVVFL